GAGDRRGDAGEEGRRRGDGGRGGDVGVADGAQPDEEGAPEPYERRPARRKNQANHLRDGRLIRSTQVQLTPSVVVRGTGASRSPDPARKDGHLATRAGYQ